MQPKLFALFWLRGSTLKPRELYALLETKQPNEKDREFITVTPDTLRSLLLVLEKALAYKNWESKTNQEELFAALKLLED